MPVLYSKWFMIICRWNLETKGCSLSHGYAMCQVFMHSQKRPDGDGHDYKTDSLVVLYVVVAWGLFLIDRKGKLYPSVRNHEGAIGPLR